MNNRLKSRLHRLELHLTDHCTLKCYGCNHMSPHLKKKIYKVEDYLYWMDKLRDGGCTWRTTCLTGGEPFINPNLLEFINIFRGYGDVIEVVTNLFWLKDLKSIDKYAKVIESIDTFIVSRYPKYAEKYDQEFLLGEITKRFNKKIHQHQEGVTDVFFINNFTEESLPIVREDCFVKNCTQLRSDGTMYRCTYGHGISIDGCIPKNVDMADMVYNIENDDRMLQDWHDKFPLSCCSHCTFAQGKEEMVDWREIE